MAKEDFDPSQDSTLVNGARLFKHVLSKGWQFGSLVGLAVATPAVAVLHVRRGGSVKDAALLQKLAKTQVIAAAVGTGLSGAMGTARALGYEDKKAAFEDRAYRLHYNGGQNRADLFANAGAALCGIGAGAVLGPTALVVLGGASVGTALGVLSHVATYSPPEKDANKMLSELQS